MKGFYLFLPFLHLLLLYPVLLLGRSSVWESNSNQTTTSISESSSVIETQSTNSPSYDHQVTSIQEIVDGVIWNSQNGDFYQVLDIKLCSGWQCRESGQPSSTELEVMIPKSWRMKSMQIHPDKISHLSIVDADKAIIEVNTAYDRLKDLESRNEYDRMPISKCLLGNRFCSFYSRFTKEGMSDLFSKTSSQSSQTNDDTQVPTPSPTVTPSDNAPTLFTTSPTSNDPSSASMINNEGEPCRGAAVPIVNEGCYSSPEAFSSIDPGQSVRGTFSTFISSDGTKEIDTDWFQVNHDGGPIMASLTSDYPSVLSIVSGFDDGGQCPTDTAVNVISYGFERNGNSNLFVSGNLPAGYYALFVSPSIYIGLECNDHTEFTYIVTLSDDFLYDYLPPLDDTVGGNNDDGGNGGGGGGYYGGPGGGGGGGGGGRSISPVTMPGNSRYQLPSPDTPEGRYLEMDHRRMNEEGYGSLFDVLNDILDLGDNTGLSDPFGNVDLSEQIAIENDIRAMSQTERGNSCSGWQCCGGGRFCGGGSLVSCILAHVDSSDTSHLLSHFSPMLTTLQ